MKKGSYILFLAITLFLVAFLGCMTVDPAYLEEQPSVPKTVADDPSIPHIELEGVVFHSETFGDPENTVVIVIHGGPGWDYKELLRLKALSDDYFVVFYDQRGTGLSPRVSPDELTLDSSLSDLNLFVDHFGRGQKVNLLGHSWGAMLSAYYISNYPERVDHVVLAEPGFLTTEAARRYSKKLSLPRGFFRHSLKANRAARKAPGLDDQAREDYFFELLMYPPAEVESMFASYFCDGELPPSYYEYWRLGYAAYRNITKEGRKPFGRFDINLVEGAENFNNKVLFIASECNSIIGVEQQKFHMQYFPNTELAVIEDSGHLMFSEKPEESLAVVRKYLREPLQ